MKTPLKSLSSLTNFTRMIGELSTLSMIITLQNSYLHTMMDSWESLIFQQKITKDNKTMMMQKDARKLNKPRRLRLREALSDLIIEKLSFL